MKDKIAKAVQEFYQKYRLHKQPKGHILVLAGKQPEGVYYLTRGEVIQYDISEQGHKTIVNIFRPNAFFPMSWAINNTENEYFFEAGTEIEYRLAPANEIVNFIKSKPEIMFDLLSRVYRGTDGMLKRTAHLMGGTARNRLLFELATECRRSKLTEDSGPCLIKLKEGDMAARTGLSRETVNRQIQTLKSEGLVEVTSNGIKINNFKDFESALDV